MATTRCGLWGAFFCGGDLWRRKCVQKYPHKDRMTTTTTTTRGGGGDDDDDHHHHHHHGDDFESYFASKLKAKDEELRRSVLAQSEAEQNAFFAVSKLDE